MPAGPPGVHVGMPSGAAHARRALRRPADRLSAGGLARAVRLRGVLAGLSTAPTLSTTTATSTACSSRLRPGGARALFGCRPPSWRRARSSSRTSGSRRAVASGGAARSTDCGPERFALVERVLRRADAPARVGRGTRSPEVAEAWRLIRRGGGSDPVAAWRSTSGWSTRHLRAAVRAEFGITPEGGRPGQPVRALGAAARDPRRRLADVAAECGYADQAHLAREWRDLAGLPPSRMARWTTTSLSSKTTRGARCWQHREHDAHGLTTTSGPGSATTTRTPPGPGWPASASTRASASRRRRPSEIQHSEMLWPEGGRVMVHTRGKADDTFATAPRRRQRLRRLSTTRTRLGEGAGARRRA